MTILAAAPPVGWNLRAHDGGAHFLPEPPHEVLCPSCGSLLITDFLPAFIKASRYEISSTYDNRMIVGDAARAVMIAAGCQPEDFVPLKSRRAQYLLWPQRVLSADTEAASTRFGRCCEVCGQPVHITGTEPHAVRGVRAPLAPGAYRSDLGFGSGPEKAPIIYVSTDVGSALREAKLRYFELYPLYASLVEDRSTSGGSTAAL